MKIVNANFKAVPDQFVSKFFGDAVFAFGNKIERRTKSQLSFQPHQVSGARDTQFAFNIVRENDRELFAFGPARPARRGSSHGFGHRPMTNAGPASSLRGFPPQSQPHRPGDKRL